MANRAAAAKSKVVSSVSFSVEELLRTARLLSLELFSQAVNDEFPGSIVAANGQWDCSYGTDRSLASPKSNKLSETRFCGS
ncbi:hypothetical protein LZ554_001278 [Drepanopeziza brunnea f. sp. 'monogermtubi']|nr:hypothetical protein LZ554_001278 [Drepanopeziza brunnea f. sp. 'monogermtubi']